MSRLHEGVVKYHLLHALDPDFLAALVEQHCGDLMREFFPGATLASFLARARRTA